MSQNRLPEQAGDVLGTFEHVLRKPTVIVNHGIGWDIYIEITIPKSKKEKVSRK